HDVNAFVRQLVDNVLDAVTAHPNARADTVDTLVRAADGDLAAVTGLASDRADLDHAVCNLRDLLFEQPLDQQRTGAAEHHADAAALRPHVTNHRAQPLVRMVRFPRNLLATRQNTFDVAERHGRRVVLVPLDDAVDELPDLTFELFDQRVPFGFTDLLNNDLLGCLGPDAADHFFR